MLLNRVLWSATLLALGCSSTSSFREGEPKGSAGQSGAGGTTEVAGNGGATGGGDAGDAGSAAEGGVAGSGAGGGGSGASGESGAGGTGGASGPACKAGAFADVLFCDDFENGLSSWQRIESAGSDGETSLSMDPVHAGEWALSSTKSAPGALDPIYADVLGGQETGRLFVRVWLFIPSETTISPGGNASILVLGEAPPADGGVSVALWETGVTIQVYDPSATPPNVQTSSFQVPLPRDRWFCAQLEFPIGPQVSTDDFKLRADRMELVNAEPAKTVDSVLSSPYERLWLGVNYINDQQASTVTVHYDDVFVDTKDVACE